MASDREQFLALVKRGDVISSRLPQALSVAGIAPSLARWRAFIDNLLVWLGASAIAAGVLFFVAYNWESMGRFAKFALIQTLMVGAVCSYVWFRRRERLGKVSLFVASILLGVLLALFGQTYQTGADPWELFATWAVLVLPWTLIARFTPLWLLFVALVNLALILYCETFLPVIPGLANSQLTLLLGLVAVNTGALVLWEWRLPLHAWMRDAWSPRLLALGVGLPATLMAVDSVLHTYKTLDWALLAGWALLMALIVYFYRYRRADLFMLAGVCFAVIVVTFTWMFNAVFLGRDESAPEFLMMAVAIIVMGASAAFWLRQMQRKMFEESQ